MSFSDTVYMNSAILKQLSKAVLWLEIIQV